jgi:hypothetical protein
MKNNADLRAKRMQEKQLRIRETMMMTILPFQGSEN